MRTGEPVAGLGWGPRAAESLPDRGEGGDGLLALKALKKESPNVDRGGDAGVGGALFGVCLSGVCSFADGVGEALVGVCLSDVCSFDGVCWNGS